MPSAETRECTPSTSTTSSKAERSTRGRALASRSRKRFEVLFASPIPSAPPALSSACSCASLSSYRFIAGVQEGAAHRVVVPDVPLAHHDLEEMGLALRRAEHLRAGPEVGAPDAPEPLVELAGIELADPFPVPVEAARPVVQRKRVVAAQVLDVHHLESAALAPVDRLGKARDPAPREDVFAYPELGVAHADVADEMDHPKAARLQVIGVGLDHLAELIAPRVLERADREQLVELARYLAEIALEHLYLALESAALDLRSRLLDLLGGGVDAGAARLVLVPGVEQQVAPAAADVGEGVAFLEQHLAADVVHLGDLRLLERVRPISEPRAGISHADLVEPLAIEVLAGAVVEAGVLLGLGDRGIAVQQLVPPVANPDEEGGLAVESGVHAGAEGVGEAALDIDVCVEIRLEEADVAEEQNPPGGAPVADEDGDVRIALVVLPGGAVGEDDAEADPGLRADFLHRSLEPGVHDVPCASGGARVRS